jgi:hypothetical protein
MNHCQINAEKQAQVTKFFIAGLLLVTVLLSGCFLSRISRAGNSVANESEFPPVAVPQPPDTSPALDLPVKITRRPATFGVPLKESFNVRNAEQIVLRDAAGKNASAQFRVLSRWRGMAGDATRPIKWLLVDSESAPGEYRLSLSATASAGNKMSVTEGAEIQVKAGRVSLRLPKQGTSLVSSFVLDNSEKLKQPVSISMEMPRTGMLADKVFAARRELLITEPAALTVGAKVRFEHLGELGFDHPAGFESFSPRGTDNMVAGRNYRIEEGTSRQEDVFAVKTDESGRLYPRSPLRFPHPRGTQVRDLDTEKETSVISAINGQTVTLAAGLKDVHQAAERITVIEGASAPLKLQANVTGTRIEETGALRTVIRQDGFFQAEGAGQSGAVTKLRFTLRYHVYANQPFIRVQCRLVNTGPYGYGGARSGVPPFTSHVILRALSVHLPVIADGAASQRIEARHFSLDKRTVTISGGLPGKTVEASVPEFAENFPKALSADAQGIRFEILPAPVAAGLTAQKTPATESYTPGKNQSVTRSGDDYLFEGSRAKTAEFYFGLETRNAATITNSTGAVIDPAYVAQSKAVRPVMVEKRDWSKVFASDRMMSASAQRMERWLASAYAREANEDPDGHPVPEYRQSGNHYGWRNFGDLEWDDGYCNLHYDLPYILLREFTRTGDARAFQIGSEMARYRADWGQYHAEDFLDKGRTWNLQGISFYEKGDHGSYREPLLTHHWIEGLWLYWALTGDEAVHQSAMEGTEAIMRFRMTFDSALSWGESRFVGWPVLGLMAAWRYSGETKYLNRARDNVYLLVGTEETFGRKGYFIPPGSGLGDGTQPFMWAGYTQLGVIEYWRETSDQRVADFMTRVADWVIKGIPRRPVLSGGGQLSDGAYQPFYTTFLWYPGKDADAGFTIYAALHLPVLMAAEQINSRNDLKEKNRQLFRDATWFRDGAQDVGLDVSAPTAIAFSSKQFRGSSPKVYGQFGLFVPEYLNMQLAQK